jgi:hypothetical protein
VDQVGAFDVKNRIQKSCASVPFKSQFSNLGNNLVKNNI